MQNPTQLKIGNKTIKVEMPVDPFIGLKDRSFLNKGNGMMFHFPDKKAHITMKDMKFNIDLLMVNDGVVAGVIPAKIGKEYKAKADMVIEVAPDSGFKKGDKVAHVAKGAKLLSQMGKYKRLQKGGKLHILDDKGEIQRSINDGSRIFSRIHTNKLFKQGLSIKNSKKGGDLTNGYEQLAKMFFKFMSIQDNQEPEYVDESK